MRLTPLSASPEYLPLPERLRLPNISASSKNKNRGTSRGSRIVDM